MPESLADLLKHYRSAAHLSQESLADRSGLSTRTISDIETGYAKTPRLISVMLIGEALGLAEADRVRLQQAARKRAATPTRLEAIPHVEPPPLLVGRDDDVAAIRVLLERDAARLVTLVGPAGVGKTSLAHRVAFDVASAFRDGVIHVDLSPLREPSLIPAAIARAAGIAENAAPTVRKAVANGLRERRMLLVLDNFEHLIAAAEWIGELLSACPDLTVVATSREPLHLRRERPFVVRPLERDAGTALFVERARAVKPDFAISAANRSAVDAIVASLEGLPLAIELAAPRLTLLPPKALAARLDRRLPFLGDGDVDLPARQRTMRGAIAWSFDLLSADEQTLFCRIALAPSGCSLEAAQRVAGDEPAPDQRFLLRLAGLVDKSLLALDEDADGEPRVIMLEMLREFGMEALAASGEIAATRERLLRYAEKLASDAEPHLSGVDQSVWGARLERELPVIRAAMESALDEGAPARALAIASALWRFWWQRGYWSEGRAWLQRLIDACGAGTQMEQQTELGRGLRALAVLLSALGDFSGAREPCERAIRLQRASGDVRGLTSSLTSLGIILQFKGELSLAEGVHRESLALRREAGNEAGVASSLSNLASLAFVRENNDDAASFARESADIYRKTGNVSGLVHALTKIGLVALAREAYADAERLFEECLQLQRTLGISGNVPYSLINLGAVAFKGGRIDDALARYREALVLLAAAPGQSMFATALESYAAAIAAGGEPADAARLYGAADALRRRIGTPLFPAERADHDASVASVRAALGSAAFETEWQIGANLNAERIAAQLPDRLKRAAIANAP